MLTGRYGRRRPSRARPPGAHSLARSLRQVSSGYGLALGSQNRELGHLRPPSAGEIPHRVAITRSMGEHSEHRQTGRPRIARIDPSKRTAEATGRRLLEIIVYEKCYRIGGKLSLDDIAQTEIGDWKMPEFRVACSYAASQGWLIADDDVLTLTTAGMRAV